MATKLNKKVSRETSTKYIGRPIIVTLAPIGGSQTETVIGLRLKGRRTVYPIGLGVVYRQAALLYGQKLANAKRAARKAGTPWKDAKKQFIKDNAI